MDFDTDTNLTLLTDFNTDLDLPSTLAMEVHNIIPATDLMKSRGQRGQIHRHKAKHSIRCLICRENMSQCGPSTLVTITQALSFIEELHSCLVFITEKFPIFNPISLYTNILFIHS